MGVEVDVLAKAKGDDGHLSLKVAENLMAEVEAEGRKLLRGYSGMQGRKPSGLSPTRDVILNNRHFMASNTGKVSKHIAAVLSSHEHARLLYPRSSMAGAHLLSKCG